jgi:inorganic pyrophosphatase
VKRTPADQPVAFVEIPKGSRNKYEYDERLGRLILDRTLYSSVVYPCDYGFLLDTIGEDDDPVDALILVAAPTFPGCLIPVDLVGVLHMRDEAGEDAKVLCVPHNDPTWTRVSSYDEIRRELLEEIAHFFEVYKDLERGKSVDGSHWEGRDAAEKEIVAAYERRELDGGDWPFEGR